VLDDDAPDVSDEEEGGVEGETTIPRPTVLRAIKAVFTRLASVLRGTVSAQPLEVQRAKAQLDHAFNVDTTSGKATDNDIKDFNWVRRCIFRPSSWTDTVVSYRTSFVDGWYLYTLSCRTFG
jgi:hypothetical protein